MKITYRHKLTYSFLVIFLLFTIGVVVFGQMRARMYRTEILESKLDAYADMVDKYLGSKPAGPHTFDSLPDVFPSNMRLTYIASDGRVVYDNILDDASRLDDHSTRPEIMKAAKEGSGSQIRTSASNDIPYMYYAKSYGNGFVRVALPYDVRVRNFLRPDNGFLYFIIALFVVGFIFIRYVGKRLGDSIQRLRSFSHSVATGAPDIKIPDFQSDELGEIGNQIAKDYELLKKNEIQLTLEREKLLQHVQSSAEGVCFFNADGSVAFYNGLFLQYLNIIGDKTDENILTLDSFRPVKEFLESEDADNYFETMIGVQGKEFLLRLNRFEDGSFEITLNDITKQEKTRRLKKDMTGNIAHELRTPVTSIRGYLETVLDMPPDTDRQRKFIEKAYAKTMNLSELIRDMGLLTKIEEDAASFDFRPIAVNTVIEKVTAEINAALTDNNSTIINKLDPALKIKGNESLVYSIFRNLADNVLRHGGKGAGITIEESGIHNEFVYISFADTGKGVKDSTILNRLFERFYRADDGRTRESGGSGLGLSIVRNAVNIHGGSISVRNNIPSGLVFTFSIPLA